MRIENTLHMISNANKYLAKSIMAYGKKTPDFIVISSFFFLKNTQSIYSEMLKWQKQKKHRKCDILPLQPRVPTIPLRKEVASRCTT